MADIIDLGAERNRREAPDSEYVRHDDFGRPLFSFLVSYDMGGARWSAEIWAYSMEDAAERVAAMRDSLRLDGQIFTSALA